MWKIAKNKEKQRIYILEKPLALLIVLFERAKQRFP